MSPKEIPHKKYTLKISCKYLHPLHFYEFFKFDQFRHRRKRKNVPFCNFFPLCPQELESNHQFHFLHKDTSKPEPLIFEALMLMPIMTKFQTDISNNLRLTCSPRRSVFPIFPHILRIPQKIVRNKCKHQIFINKWLDKAIQKVKLHVLSNVSWKFNKKNLIMQILWFAEHRSILPVFGHFFHLRFLTEEGFAGCYFNAFHFSCGSEKTSVKQQLNLNQKSSIKWIERIKKKYRLSKCAAQPFCLQFWKWYFTDVALLNSHKKTKPQIIIILSVLTIWYRYYKVICLY